MAISSGAVSFSHLQTQYNSVFDPDLANPNSLSEYRGATFSTGSAVPASGAISVGTDFRGRTFAAAALISYLWTFASQTAATDHTTNWSPSGDMSSWVNGASAVDGTYWAWDSNKTVKGWNLSNDTDSNSTPSSSTGPAGGGYDGSTGFAYTEVSSSKHLYCFVMRSPGTNFSTAMASTSNDLTLTLHVHAYGADMGELRVYIDDAASSNDSAATQLTELTDWSAFSAHSSSWLTVSISLNSYRTVDATHYIYIVSQNATYWKGDMSVDSVGIIEQVALLSLTYNFASQTAATDHTTNWSPSGDMSSWVNGASAVDGTYWAWDSNKTVKGWNLSNDTDSNATPSPSTGPAGGGYDGSTGFAYTEVSSSKHLYCFVMRSPGTNFSTAMASTSNDLTLTFHVHAYGADMGELRVYIDDAASSNDSAATQLTELTDWSSFTGHSSLWLTVSINLNSYRTVDATHYIYIVSQNATYWKGDMSVDYVRIREWA